MYKMSSFRVRDTSSQYQPISSETPVPPITSVEEKGSNKNKSSLTTSVSSKPLPVATQSSSGFQMKYDYTNQYDYF